MTDHDRPGEPGVFRKSRRHHPAPPEGPVERSRSARFLQRTLPESWRFAQQMTLDLLRQVEFLGWPDRAETFDTYFVRQAEGMLRPQGLTDLVNGTCQPPVAEPPAPESRDAIARFALWSRSLVTGVLLELDEGVEVSEPDQALTYILGRDFLRARAAARWTAQHGLASIGGSLERLPGYALVLLASSPNDTAERFLARDAFWTAVMRSQPR